MNQKWTSKTEVEQWYHRALINAGVKFNTDLGLNFGIMWAYTGVLFSAVSMLEAEIECPISTETLKNVNDIIEPEVLPKIIDVFEVLYSLAKEARSET